VFFALCRADPVRPGATELTRNRRPPHADSTREVRGGLEGTRACRSFRSSLAHFRDLDTRFAQLVQPSKHDVRDIEASLRAKGAPDTYHVLSESAALDGREMPLASALADIVGRGMGAFVSCIPGKLGYFELALAGQQDIHVHEGTSSDGR